MGLPQEPVVIDEIVTRLIDLAICIQQIPAPTFFEEPRAKFIQQRFLAERLSDVAMDKAGNVYARWPGKGMVPPVIVTAHLDTVFPANTDLQIHYETNRVNGPGIGDNALGLAGLFGLLWSLRPAQEMPETSGLPGDLWLVATTGEEGLGDLRGMRAAVERFGEKISAYLVLEGMAYEHIYHRALGVKRYRVYVQTAGGHSWSDHGSPSAIHELAAIINRLTALHLPANPRTSLNVGVINGGTTINSIAAQATCELDLRSENNIALQLLVQQAETIFRNARKNGVQVMYEVIGQRPTGEIPEKHWLVRAAQQGMKEHGMEAIMSMGSTDANVPLSQGLPAIVLGLTSGDGAHSTQEYIETQPIAGGLAALTSTVRRIFEDREKTFRYSDDLTDYRP